MCGVLYRGNVRRVISNNFHYRDAVEEDLDEERNIRTIWIEPESCYNCTWGELAALISAGDDETSSQSARLEPSNLESSHENDSDSDESCELFGRWKDIVFTGAFADALSQ